MEAAAVWRRDREWEQRALLAAYAMLPNTEKGTDLSDLYRDVVNMLPGYKPGE